MNEMSQTCMCVYMSKPGRGHQKTPHILTALTISRRGSPASLCHTCSSLSARAMRPWMGIGASVTLLSPRFSVSDSLELVDEYWAASSGGGGSLPAWAPWTVSEFLSGIKSNGPPLHLVSQPAFIGFFPSLYHVSPSPIRPCSSSVAPTCTQTHILTFVSRGMQTKTIFGA